MTTPQVEGYLTQPYVTVAEFKSAPTWLDVDDLIPGGGQNQQDDELFNVLLKASRWADNFCNKRLGAHTAYEQFRTRIDRYGRVKLYPSDSPVRKVVAFAYGPDPQLMTTLTDFTQVWIENSQGIVVSSIPFRGSFFGSLEFGMIPIQGTEIFCQIQYVAGYACTALSSSVTAGSSSLVVQDPTGFLAPAAPVTGLSVTLPGSTARIWDPAAEEAVTVSAINGSTLTLTSPLLNSHTVNPGVAGQVNVSELPPEIHQAVVSMAVALMLREDAGEEEPFAGSPGGPSLRRSASGGAAAGLLDNAYELLEPYRRVR